MTTTARLDLPMLVPGQAQKEMTHNEALARLDLAVQACAISVGLEEPPTSPEPGQCWILGANPTGDWLGNPHRLTSWSENGWRFLQPFPGLLVWLLDDNTFAQWDGVTWVKGKISAATIAVNGVQVVGPRQPAIANPVGGATVDVEARMAIDDILSALREHGLVDNGQ